jgi:uncharacterized protein (DUF736 family)
MDEFREHLKEIVDQETGAQAFQGLWKFRGEYRHVELAPTAEKRDKEKSPDFIIHVMNAKGRLVDFGAAWFIQKKGGSGKYLRLLFREKDFCWPGQWYKAFPPRDEGEAWGMKFDGPATVQRATADASDW